MKRACKNGEGGRTGTCIASEHRRPRVDKLEYLAKKRDFRDQKRKAFLSKRAKKLFTDIISNTNEEQRKGLQAL